MADKTDLMSLLPLRKSIYALSPTSPIPDSRIHEITREIVYHSPSSFNVQSVRVVLLLGQEHQKLWKEVLPAAMKAQLGEEDFREKGWQGKLEGYAKGYGCALFYDAPEAWEELWGKMGERAAGVKGFETEWAEHTSGMHQFALWSALSAEGLGCNLQHYTWLNEAIANEWSINKRWKLRAQLNFGKPEGGRRQERTYKPVDGERLIVHKS